MLSINWQVHCLRSIRGIPHKDVAVDVRGGSATFGKWYGVELTEENKKQFLIPRGFAHGFLVLSDTAEFCYKCDDFYHPDDEGGIAWNDPEIGIAWPGVDGTKYSGTELNLSAKDRLWPCLSQQNKSF